MYVLYGDIQHVIELLPYSYIMVLHGIYYNVCGYPRYFNKCFWHFNSSNVQNIVIL